MRLVIQRSLEASVIVDGEIIGEILEGQRGFVILIGIEPEDTQEDIDWLVGKVTKMRLFEDEEGRMGKSILDIDGEYLVVSQFTLHASTKKGNRPSYSKAAKPDIAIPLYEAFVKSLGDASGKIIATGEFGADMKVSLVNDGPVTIIIDSKNRE